MKNYIQMISCICVTKGRANYLPNVIGAFLNQTYLNKELVILYEKEDTETLDFLGELIKSFGSNSTISYAKSQDKIVLESEWGNIIIICDDSPVKKTLGSLRNLAISHANGMYVCQWDDDDTYHPDRLKKQFELLTREGKSACTLARWMIFDELYMNIYESNSRVSGWEGSILCARDKVGKYEDLSRGEDTAVIDSLWEQGEIVLLDQAELYIYTLHGQNTWHREHFESILALSTIMPTEYLHTVQKLIDDNNRSFARLLDSHKVQVQ